MDLAFRVKCNIDCKDTNEIDILLYRLALFKQRRSSNKISKKDKKKPLSLAFSVGTFMDVLLITNNLNTFYKEELTKEITEKYIKRYR